MYFICIGYLFIDMLHARYTVFFIDPYVYVGISVLSNGLCGKKFLSPKKWNPCEKPRYWFNSTLQIEGGFSSKNFNGNVSTRCPLSLASQYLLCMHRFFFDSN